MIGDYDCLTQRNPLFTRAEQQLTYELVAFRHHYHPTVRLFAKQILKVSLLFICEMGFHE